jgi:hypothetical protein
VFSPSVISTIDVNVSPPAPGCSYAFSGDV